MEVLLETKNKEGDNLDGIMVKFIQANGSKEKKHGSGLWSSPSGDSYMG